MTEQEWVSSSDPAAMLAFLTHRNAYPAGHEPPPGGVSDRQLRLWVCACLASSDQRLVNTPQYGYFDYGAEGEKIPSHELVGACRNWAMVQNQYDPPKALKAHFLRDVVGNPFRPAMLRGQEVEDGRGWVVPWLTPQVRALAAAAYESSGKCQRCKNITHSPIHAPHLLNSCPACHGVAPGLDPVMLSVLADALEDASCTDADVLGHLRGPGPHVRGCWVLSLLLGQE